MAADKDVTYNQVTIIGTGALGCSIAGLLKGRGLAGEVVGMDISQAHLEMAQRLGFVDRTIKEASRSVMGSHVVVLAVPLDEVFKVLDEIGPDVRPGAVVTCTAGSTARLRTQLIRHVRSAENFVPAYPLVHIRGTGPGGANPTELAQARCMVAAGGELPGKAAQAAQEFWSALGLEVSPLSSDAFESAVAGHRYWPMAIALAARRIADRGGWPEGKSPLKYWLEQFDPQAVLDRSFQLYSSRLCALLGELVTELEDQQRTLGGAPSNRMPDCSRLPEPDRAEGAAAQSEQVAAPLAAEPDPPAKTQEED